MFKKLTSRVAMLAMVMTVSAMVGCESSEKADTRLKGDLPKVAQTSETPSTTVEPNTYWRDVQNTGMVKQPAPQPQPAPKPTPSGMVSTSVPFPTGVVPGSGLMVTKTAPAQVVVNSPFDYTITAKNLTKFTLKEVQITDQMPESFKVNSSDPQGQISGDTGTWNLGDLPPGQSVTITVNGTATAPGELVNCAAGSYSLLACVTTQVIQPALKITKSGPKEVLRCDPIQYTITVSNTGTGNATGVVVEDSLPDGVTTTDGKSDVKVNIGTLASGASRTVTINARANKTGNFTNTAVASADGNLKAQAKVTTKVTAPDLAITKKGPARTFIGKTITYDMTVTNKGDGVAKGVMVSDGIPAGTTFVSATEGGTLDAGSVVWNFGDLAPGQSKAFKLTVKAGGKGTVKNAVAASAACAESVTATAETVVEGIPAILLEVIDVEDPVAVGENTTYVIEVTNQGSADGKNIKIVATLAGSQSFVSASGATKHQAQGKKVTFEALPSLAPKAKVTWRVTVKADAADDARFSVELTEDQLTKPVNETEATNLYEGG